MTSILSLTFSNIFTEENNTVIPTTLNIFHVPDEEKLHVTKIHVHKVCKYLQKIDLNKSIGPDEVSTLMPKQCCAQLESPTTHLFNKPLTLTRVPRAWKRTNITPILKKR